MQGLVSDVSCFNPYFSGSVTGTVVAIPSKLAKLRFNPYFSGSVTGTGREATSSGQHKKFQSLF